MDSLRIEQIKALDKGYRFQINTLNDEIKKKNNHLMYWKVGGITVSAGLLLFLLFK